MWASSMALNGLCGSGKPGAWTCHPIEHELSAFYDITHEMCIRDRPITSF